MPADTFQLRIALAIGIYQPARGGAAEWLRDYARWLQNQGHTVCIVCEQAETTGSDTIALLTLPKSQHTKNSCKRAVALQRLVAGQAFDIVHDSGCLLQSDVFHPLMGSLIHNWYRQLRAYPLALRLRRFWHVRLWRDVRLQWQQQRHHSMLVACSRRVAADFRQLGWKNSVIIPNGIPLPPVASAESILALRRELDVGNRLLVLVTATNFYLKGVMKVLQAMAHLDEAARKKFRVVITGQIPDAVFQNYINQHQLQDVCRLAGWVEDIDFYYQAADIFLHPTYHDAGSLSTLKALAAGTAVVTSRFDGSAEWITNGVHGLILERPENTSELAATLGRLLDAPWRKKLGEAARQASPLFAQERQFKKLEEIYFRLRSRRAPDA